LDAGCSVGHILRQLCDDACYSLAILEIAISPSGAMNYEMSLINFSVVVVMKVDGFSRVLIRA